MKLRFLAEIYLDKNNLSSTVPNFFANFPSLKTLSLSACNLQGAFPREIFQTQGLQELILSNNQNLSGSFPSFPENGSLRMVSVSYTQFSGSLPPSISNLSNLSRIEITNCKFSGSIPSTMAQLTNLIYVDFSFNNFTGSIPHFQRSKNLTYIDLSRNGLTGSISSKHFEDLSKIVNINLGTNLLSGRIPPSVFSLPSLQKLVLSSNLFDGQVDNDDEYLNVSASQLDTLDLSSNRLNGSIPEHFFKLSKLNVLLLSSNSFSGRVQFGSLKKLMNLTRFELSKNNLSVDVSGNIPTSSFFPQIKVLKMASCRLQSFPDLRTQSSMIHLDLSDNEIRGEIPNWIWNVGNGSLAHLNLSCNFLDGLEKPYTIPSSLSVLDLHSNQLQGQLPMASTSGAIYLDYSNNFFNSSIPSDLGKENQISGSIPDSFPSNCPLKTLDLSRNSFDGKIPKSLINCSSLEVLNVGSNKIVDTFPCPLKNISSLRVLVLRSNGFHGDLHCENANQSWPNLQIIDIASNHFSGNLSRYCFSNWKGMIVDEDTAQSAHHISGGGPVFDSEFDWHFIFIGLGYGIGASVSMAALFFWKAGRTSSDKHLKELLKLIIPSYRFPYIRYNGGRVQAEEIIEDATPDDTDDSDEDEDEMEGKAYRGRYCVFCSKLDIHRKRAIHNPDCTCSHHHSSPLPPSITSSSTSLLVIYQKVI
nr:receptor-like protein 12 [Ipomoea batatas]